VKLKYEAFLTEENTLCLLIEENTFLNLIKPFIEGIFDKAFHVSTMRSSQIHGQLKTVVS
jgi:hypothetical protein